MGGHMITCPVCDTANRTEKCTQCGTDLGPLFRLESIREKGAKNVGEGRGELLQKIKQNESRFRKQKKLLILLPVLTFILGVAVPFLLNSGKKAQEILPVESAAEAVKNRIDKMPDLKEAQLVVSGSEGIIRISGEVPSGMHKALAAQVASDAAGGTKVITDDIRVKQEKPREYQIRHRVRKGETLAAIAGIYYKDSRDWRLIYETNRSRIVNPNRIPRGVELLIPLLEKDLIAGQP